MLTIAIRSREQAMQLADKLERGGVPASLCEVDERHSALGVGLRVRIDEADLCRALQIIERPDETPVADGATSKLLVPIDFSDYSFRACETAFRLAQLLHCGEVVLLHAYIIPHSFVSIRGRRAVATDKEGVRHFMASLRSDMDNLKRKIAAEIASGALADVRFSTVSVEGVPEDAIVDYCNEHKPLLVVMGTRGRDKKQEDLIGSVTAEVIEYAQVPVLAIPETSSINLSAGCNVLFATNFDERTLISFDRLVRIFGEIPFHLHLAHFETKPDEWNEIKLAGIKEYIRSRHPEIQTEYTVLSSLDAPDAFEKYVTEHQIDLIVLNTHKRSLLARMFNPSMARRMVFYARTPILAFHD